MSKSPLLFIMCFFYSLTLLGQNAVLTGELKQYHKVTLTWENENFIEEASTFKNYRLNTTFISPSGKTYIVPGYFAADGNAAETSATSGTKWRCHFTPLEIGSWSYVTSFRTADDIAISFEPLIGTPVESIDGDLGSFVIMETDKFGLDFRAKGKLEYVGEHYLQWSNGEYFLKLGTNTPEVFLEYVDFDNSPQNPRPGFFDRDYSAHILDWQDGDPLWKGEKGKGIIGAVNYLSNQGVNAHYFLTDSSYGDTDTVFPWTSIDEHYVFDVSKLDQWQIVFDHMMSKGVKVHFVLSEAEQQSLFELFDDADGDPLFANARKIYYREMVARFGYLNAITWNLGEESGWDRPGHIYGRGLTSQQQISFADYVDNLAYYNDHITLQNGHANDDSVFAKLIGNNSFTGASLQGVAWNTQRSKTSVLNWREKSSLANKKWAINYDEAYHSNDEGGLIFREKSLWASLTAGAAGFEYYVPQNTWDWRIQNYSQYEEFWGYMRYAKKFFTDNNIPFHEMESKDQIVSNGWCFGKDYEVYVVYLPSQSSTKAEITGEYSVKWFDPRNGGPLLDGSITKVDDGSNVNLGYPPNSPDLDWIILLQNVQTDPVNVTGISVTPDALSIGIDKSIQLVGEVLPLNANNSNFVWSSDNPSVASVDTNGKVTTHSYGEVTITATSAEGNFTGSTVIKVPDSSNFCSATGTLLMERYDGINGTELNSLFNATTYPNNPTSVLELNEFQIPINAADDYGTRVSGYLCAPESGTYYFWVAGDDNTQLSISTDINPLNSKIIAFHNSWTDSQQWNKFPTQKSSGIDLVIGQNYYIEAIMKEGGGGDNLAVSWRKPSNRDDVDPIEIIPGEVLSPFNPRPVTSMAVTPEFTIIESGRTTMLIAMISPIDAYIQEVHWSSNNTNIAVVDNDGLVTSIAPGNATISVTTEDGLFTASSILTVIPPPISVTGVIINSSPTTIHTKNTMQLHATLEPSNADNQNVSWSSSDSNIATVDNNGLVTAISPGNATITVNTVDGEFKANSIVSVILPPVLVNGVTISPITATIQKGNSLMLLGEVLPYNADNQDLIWSTSDKSVASVDNDGLVTGVKPGNAVITVKTLEGEFETTSIITVEDIKLAVVAHTIYYPNPADNIVRIQLAESTRTKKILIYDSVGRLVLSFENEDFNSNDDDIQFSVLHLPEATYFVQVITESSEIIEFRLIKEPN